MDRVPWIYEVFQLLLYKLHHRRQSVPASRLKRTSVFLACFCFVRAVLDKRTHDSSLHRAVHFRPFSIELALFSPPAHIHIMTGNRKSSFPTSPECLRRVDSWKVPVPSLMLFERKVFPMLSMAASSLPCSRTAPKQTKFFASSKAGQCTRFVASGRHSPATLTYP